MKISIPSEIIEIMDSIENEDMRNFAYMCLDTIPSYFWFAPSSSTGKYHPIYALGKGGLVRHTSALVRIMNHTFDIKCMNNWTSRERDCLRIAGFMHDTRKSGSQEDYEKNKFTKHEHPLLAAEVIRGFKGCEIIEDDEIEIIANAIESHMGAFVSSKYSDIILPEPKNKYQKMLHWCDYIVSRSDIEIKFNNIQNNDTWQNYILDFGKHKGKTLLEVNKIDPEYITWMKENLNREPINTYINQLNDKNI